MIEEHQKTIATLKDEMNNMKSMYESEMENAIAEITKLHNALSSIKSNATIPVGQQSFKATPSKEKNAVELARERMISKLNNNK